MTGAQFIHLATKKLMGVTSFKEYFFDYIRTAFADMFAAVFNKDGTFGVAALEISESGSLLSIDDGTGTDGAGHFLQITATEKDVPWPRDGEHSVGLKYAERPVGIQINPRTGRPEYQNWQEAIGERGEPDEVVDMSGTHLRITVDSLGESGVTMAGRTALVWLTTPAPGATTEGIAIEQCTVVFDAGTNYIDTVGLLGNTTADISTLNYQVLILGPTIRSDDLEPVAGYWFVGRVNYSGSFSFDGADQRLITKSLSDLLDYLVYSNVVNGFTRGQTITAVGYAENGLDVIGGTSSVGIDVKGGTGNTNGLSAEGVGTGTGLFGKGGSSDGYGVNGWGQGSGAGVYGYGGASHGEGGKFGGGPGWDNGGDGVVANGGVGNNGPGGAGITATAGNCDSGGAPGISATGKGSGPGGLFVGGLSGEGIKVYPGASAPGIYVEPSPDGDQPGIRVRGGYTNGPGIYCEGMGTGAAIKISEGAGGHLELLWGGLNVTAPRDGVMWYDGTHLYFRIGSTTHTLI